MKIQDEFLWGEAIANKTGSVGIVCALLLIAKMLWIIGNRMPQRD